MSKAVVFDQPGQANVLRVADIPDTQPKPNEVVIRHTAIEVNYLDILHRTGQYPLNSNPKVPGVSAVGVIESVGSNIKDFFAGQRVGYATAENGGAYSQKNCVPAHVVFGIPDDINDKVAASCLVKGLTAHYLSSRAYLPGPGKNVLVHAAAGGVGQLLTQWCSYYGAKVIGTVGSDQKKDIALKNGCHEAINYNTEDWLNRVLQITDGFGVHCVYDSVGKSVYEGNIKALVEVGLYILYGSASGIPEIGLNDLAAKSLFFTRPSIFGYKRQRSELVMSTLELFEMIRNKKLTPSVFQELPLEKAADAHAMIESRKTTGSIILIP